MVATIALRDVLRAGHCPTLRATTALNWGEPVPYIMHSHCSNGYGR